MHRSDAHTRAPSEDLERPLFSKAENWTRSQCSRCFRRDPLIASCKSCGDNSESYHSLNKPAWRRRETAARKCWSKCEPIQHDFASQAAIFANLLARKRFPYLPPGGTQPRLVT